MFSYSPNPEFSPCARTFLDQPDPLGSWIWTPKMPSHMGKNPVCSSWEQDIIFLFVVTLSPTVSGNHSLLLLSLLGPLFPCLSGWCSGSSFLAQHGCWELYMVLGWKKSSLQHRNLANTHP